MIKALVFTFALVSSFTAQAHKASDAYLSISFATQSAPQPELRLSVALRDADRAFDGLDANNDRQLTLGEVKAAMPVLLAWANQGMALQCESKEQPSNFAFEALEQRSDGVFARLKTSLPRTCNLANTRLRYSLMQDLDADHRAILSVASAEASARVLSPSSSFVPLQSAEPSVWQTLASFITLGISHIGSGADHIAFVICLVLGITPWRDWQALLTTVTAFTVGHSITLVAATVGWVGSPGWVEPMIAASIALAAALNLFSIRAEWAQSLWLKACVATGFGLVHGLGFSGAMTEAQVPQGTLLWALAGFNLGVEIGQLLIIAAWSAVYFSLRAWVDYQRWVVQAGSMALILIAVYWTAERMGML
jgi:hydrogenase/urease accessory protein HupE